MDRPIINPNIDPDDTTPFDISEDRTEPPADPEHADDGFFAFFNVGFAEEATGVPASHRADPSIAKRGFAYYERRRLQSYGR